MSNNRARAYAKTVERLYELDPDAARAIEHYVGHLRAEAARQRLARREVEQQAARQQVES